MQCNTVSTLLKSKRPNIIKQQIINAFPRMKILMIVELYYHLKLKS